MVIVGWSIGLGVLMLVVLRLRRQALLRDRLAADTPTREEAYRPATSVPRSGLRAWLARAGFRNPVAPSFFIAATLATILLGGVALWILFHSPVLQTGLQALLDFPGGVGEVFIPILYGGPWLVATVLALLPWLIVRATRRERVAQIEQDLPLVLELLATLGDAGLGFDAALDRIISAQPQDRPLTQEFRRFQRDLLAGTPRVTSLRNLAARVDVLSLTIFISALVQADQVGASMADVLRRQAEDARARRRERAISIANTLPVKLLFPLVICFLPGLFVATLGPTFYQFFQFADTIIQNRAIPAETAPQGPPIIR